jgi:hypothetical protein
VSETTVKRLLCCGFPRNSKALGHVRYWKDLEHLIGSELEPVIVGHQIPTTEIINITVFWDVTPCKLVYRYNDSEEPVASSFSVNLKMEAGSTS